MTSPERLSFWIAWVGGLTIASVGASLYLQDGSYFLDEASVVLSFQERTILESFTGPLSGGGQSFPRFYLLLIRGVRELFGPETWATRLLPHLAFLAATLLWTRLLAIRFGRRPALVLLGVTLIAVTPSWWFYSALVKQYSLDVLLTLALFSVPDRVISEAFSKRARAIRLLPLLLPLLFSYVYGVALLARLSGWVAFGLRRGFSRPDSLVLVAFVVGFGSCTGVLYVADLQFTMGRTELVKLWGNCVISENPGGALEILRRFFASWYLGPSEYVQHPKLPIAAVWALLAAAAIGALRVGTSIVRSSSGSDRDVWGSRSAGCLAGVVGVALTSVVLDYPICAGRLTLYALFFQQVLILEGFEAAHEFIGSARATTARRRAQAVFTAAVMSALIGSAGLAAFRVSLRVTAVAPLENVRPFIAQIPEDTAETVFVTPCMDRQVRTLPEGLGDRRVVHLPVEDWAPMLPRGESIWVIHSRLIPGLCEKYRRRLRGMTHGFESDAAAPADGRRETAVVYHATVKTEDELREHRRDVLRALKRASEAAKQDGSPARDSE